MRIALLIFLVAALVRAQTSDPQFAPGNAPPPPPAQQPPEQGQSLPPGPPPPPPPPPGQQPPQGQQSPQGQQPPPPNAQNGTKVEEVRTILQGIFEDYRYDPIGKRDPFLPYTAPKQAANECGPFEDCDAGALERFDLDQLKLVGIIWDVKTPKAMFVDPSNKTYFVNEQDKIGRNNGYIAEIREGELIVIEKFYNLGRFTYQTKVIKLKNE